MTDDEKQNYEDRAAVLSAQRNNLADIQSQLETLLLRANRRIADLEARVVDAERKAVARETDPAPLPHSP